MRDVFRAGDGAKLGLRHQFQLTFVQGEGNDLILLAQMSSNRKTKPPHGRKSASFPKTPTGWWRAAPAGKAEVAASGGIVGLVFPWQAPG